jgi:uncharacterized membrane protein YdjX (TVP38/TMEM64 family)
MLGWPLFILVVLVVVGRYAGRFWPELEASVAQLGHAGLFLFFGAWVLMAMTCFPVSVLGVSAGALFGPWLGMALVFPAGLAAGSIMFWLGRGLLRNRILIYVASHPKLAAIDRLAGDQALKLNLLTRLSPLNFGLASYTLATGRTTFRGYFWGLFAILPSLMGQVWFGSLAREAGRSADDGGFSAGKIGLLIVGVGFFGLLTWVVGRMVKKAWDEAPDEDTTDRQN